MPRPFSVGILIAIVLAITACTPAGSRGPASEPAVHVLGMVTAGPTCPVERDPPDPACAPRPVDGAVISIRDANGGLVATVTSAADGSFTLQVAPGMYRLVAQPVDALPGTPSPIDLQVGAGEREVPVTVSYDTGIR